MSTRVSGFARKEHEHYPTPPWLIDALAEHLELSNEVIWEPACGTGVMAEALLAKGSVVYASDVYDHGYEWMSKCRDFLDGHSLPTGITGIATNPPYGTQGRLAYQFIKAGLRYVESGCWLALLLPVDFDSAKTRRDVFRDCPYFDTKIVLTKRIKWFEPPEGEKSSGPSDNHAWFVWLKKPGSVQGPAIIRYAPNEDRVAA